MEPNWASISTGSLVTITHNLNIDPNHPPNIKILFSTVVYPSLLTGDVINDISNQGLVQQSASDGFIVCFKTNNICLIKFGSSHICSGLNSSNNITQYTSGYIRVYVYK